VRHSQQFRHNKDNDVSGEERENTYFNDCSMNNHEPWLARVVGLLIMFVAILPTQGSRPPFKNLVEAVLTSCHDTKSLARGSLQQLNALGGPNTGQ
jgi:hypothetical protein